MEYFRIMLLGLNVDKRAVTALEYTLIASVIAVVLVTGFKTFYNSVNTVLQTAVSTAG